MEAIRKNLIVIAGPTAVGKTAVALQLAGELKTEIISADSRQFFREMTIGTAKPAASELRETPHHFIDSHSIRDDYDAASFGDDALAVIHNILKDHDYAILCGGSGLYIKAVVEGFDDIPEVPEEIRETLVKNYDLHGIGWLQQKMMESDPEHFQTIDRQNPHRLIRALEVKIGTGASIASFRNNGRRKLDFNVIKIGLELPRETLYKRIDDRMDHMIAAGLFQEAEQLYAFRKHRALQTVGYQEIFDFMDGRYDREEAIRLLKRNSRRYAKRQLTWFKRDAEIKWFGPEDVDSIKGYILRRET